MWFTVNNSTSSSFIKNRFTFFMCILTYHSHSHMYIEQVFIFNLLSEGSHHWISSLVSEFAVDNVCWGVETLAQSAKSHRLITLACIFCAV